MAAGVRQQHRCPTGGTGRPHGGAVCAAATPHRTERPVMPRQQTGTVLGEQLRFEGLDDIGQADHDAAPQRSSNDCIICSMAPAAFSWVTSVRWA